ncbi:hypothetical protein [Rhizobium jaguaris]|nr:hypothetical protein [Rhizobium jaguaris]
MASRREVETELAVDGGCFVQSVKDANDRVIKDEWLGRNSHQCLPI